jgi:hypothetical protein
VLAGIAWLWLHSNLNICSENQFSRICQKKSVQLWSRGFERSYYILKIFFYDSRFKLRVSNSITQGIKQEKCNWDRSKILQKYQFSLLIKVKNKLRVHQSREGFYVNFETSAIAQLRVKPRQYFFVDESRNPSSWAAPIKLLFYYKCN